MYKYYSSLGFFLIKKRGRKRYSKWNIQQYTIFHQKPSSFQLSSRCFFFTMINKSFSNERSFLLLLVTLSPWISGKKHIINFTTYEMTSNFEAFSKNKMVVPYITESMWTDWLQMLDEYREKVDTSYSSDFDLFPDWFFNITLNLL